MRHRWSWTQVAFIAPAAVLLVVFLLVPFVMAFWLSLTNMRLVPGPLPTQFVGLANYQRMLGDGQFWTSLGNNLLFAAVVVPVQSALALGLALLVNQKLRFTTVFRTIYFMPTVTPMVVVAVIWSFLYHPEGLINGLLAALPGIPWKPVDFLHDSRWAFPAIMITSIWQGVGFQMLIFLAALQEVPASLLEAADVDGANMFQKFFFITLPQLRNAIIFVVVATTILAFRLFDQVQIMTAGGPRNATYTMILYVYNTGFQRLNVGYASALTVVFFLIVLVISIVQRAVVREEK